MFSLEVFTSTVLIPYDGAAPCSDTCGGCIVQLLRKEGGAEAVESAVAVAVAARDSELSAMQRHIMDLEDALDAALQEAADAQHESLELRNALAHLEAALRDSEAKRCACTHRMSAAPCPVITGPHTAATAPAAARAMHSIACLQFS